MQVGGQLTSDRRRPPLTPTSIGRPRCCMGTRREVAVKPSYGTGHPGTGSNAPAVRRQGSFRVPIEARLRVWNRLPIDARIRSAERLNCVWAGRTHPRWVRRNRKPRSDRFVRTRSPFRSAHLPHGRAQQAMVLSCESMAGQRHAGSARARRTDRPRRRNDHRERSALSRSGQWGLGDDAG
jgi:hypothetical protein